jgi:hypothetical protein
MTAPTLAPSAYPPPVAKLIPEARALADQLGKVPSRNQLMQKFKVGAPKAIALREALVADPAVPPAPAAEPPAPAAAVELLPAPELAEVAPLPEPVALAEAVTAAAPPVVAPTVAAPAAAGRRPVVWPVLILCLPAFVAIWAGWVAMGRLTGFGKVTLLPGIADHFQLDTAITLPIGVETYAAYALWVWLSGRVTGDARRFAKWSAIASLAIGAAGQIAYHLMNAWGWSSAPWPITAVVACIPVAVLGMGAALAHLMHNEH